ncbi:MAG: adenylate/guanylate cyclase domain-containing protein [Cyanobacteria bacterium J06626_23]
MQIAPAVANYLLEVSTRDRAFVQIHITPEGQILDWQGDLSRYEIVSLMAGAAIEDYLFFLSGLLPLTTPQEVLPSIQLEAGPIVDIHLISGQEDDGWVLLFDSTATTQQRQRLQQKGNDLSLLRHEYNKLLQQCLPRPSDSLPAPLESHQRDISLLLVRICNLTHYSRQTAPADTLRVLNRYLSQITQMIVEEGGVINHVLGEAAVAFFGLLPSQLTPAQQAMTAAKRMMRHFVSTDADGLGVGSGISTGPATAGVVRNQSQASLNAIGPPIHQLDQLANSIRPGRLVIDDLTYHALTEVQQEFQALAAPQPRPAARLYAWRGLPAERLAELT